jgi:hypothetical protein
MAKGFPSQTKNCIQALLQNQVTKQSQFLVHFRIYKLRNFKDLSHFLKIESTAIEGDNKEASILMSVDEPQTFDLSKKPVRMVTLLAISFFTLSNKRMINCRKT